ncbi:2,3,4,5-tetrahydropyridine-2,6-dicarboxylate N-acetyltransferase [Candidatus Stoquefichus sp. SB1]|uniref:2,3,4,5-tetrahydropyridine-2,6-dicarboxylate N-acetyltransferase n=1 Tax=Candidatus Stoquefichus sp. SB1 TaxID=1658109 RepID=UPI00067F07C9|nr:2,3,4,5-tetrahydropyridine-2,6-dicarboxylate N-acetyltransferase [Candidatus Stoquefichus sp. SB1]
MDKTAQEIIEYIGNAKKQTPVKVYVKGHDLPESDEFKSFGDASTKVLIGDLTVIQKYLEDHQQLIIDSYLEQDRRHSAIPMLDLTNINARIEPGALIRDNVEIGDNAVVMMGAIINIGAKIGEGSMIDMGAILGGRAQVGKRCHVGAGAVLAGVIEPPSAMPVILEDDVLVGANAVIVEGVHIGQGAVIGAGSIVLKDVPAGAVVAGNPAKIIKTEKSDQTKEKTQLMDDLRKL